jgi:uncharacterized protein (TIGR04222 family)
MSYIFDLPGGTFLLLYLLLCFGLVTVARLLRRLFEPRDPGPVLDDPYAIAILRGDAPAMTRLATVHLVESGALVAEGERVTLGSPEALGTWHPVEAAIIDLVRKRGSIQAAAIVDEPDVRAATTSVEADLTTRGLYATPAAAVLRLVTALGGALVLVATGYHKLELAAARGHHNVGFLLLLMLGLPIVAVYRLMKDRRTLAGRRALADLEAMLAHGDHNDGSTRAQLIAAAALGSGAYSQATTTLHARLYPAPPPNVSSDSTWFIGSSCSSSCGSSCGGGCGGGCGGCGGG